jgi:hypothetical protein
MKQRFIVETENDDRIRRASVEEALIKELAPYNVTVREEVLK